MAKYSDRGKDPYTYPDSDVLRNRLGLKDQGSLDKAESSFSAIRSYELNMNPVAGRFDLAHLQEIHLRLFSDVYDWAGKLRNVDISKGDTRFANASHIESAGQQLFRQLSKETHLRGLAPDELSARLGHYLGEINVLHPFREGNGRSQREFVGQLARENGFRIDWDGISQADMLKGSIEAYHGSSERLGHLIRQSLIDVNSEIASGEVESSEPSLEEQLTEQEKSEQDLVEPSLEQQLEAQAVSAAPPTISKAYRSFEHSDDEPGMDM